jgi:hypothetical protein
VDLRAAHTSAIGATIIPAVMTSGSDIIANAPAIQANDGCVAGSGAGRGGGEVEATNRGAAGGGGAAAAGFAAGRAVSDR